MSPVTLQINLAPSDYRHAKYILPHQMRVWRGQVAEILLVIDLHRSSGRFSHRWEEGLERIFTLARSIEGARVVTVDYTPPAAAAVAKEFFGGRRVPIKDHRGGPYYAYFFGLHAASHPHVLHLDADMLFGGGSPTWIEEALDLLRCQPDILVTAPLPGPPSPSGRLVELVARPLNTDGSAFDFPEMSTRTFLLDRNRFRDRIGALPPTLAPFKACLLAWLDGNPPRQIPEILFTRTMARHHLRRVDFLGAPAGMWSLHPPYRCEDFYRHLPAIVARVESGDVPAGQLGHHDVNDSLVDWTEARTLLATHRWWNRLATRLFTARR